MASTIGYWALVKPHTESCFAGFSTENFVVRNQSISISNRWFLSLDPRVLNMLWARCKTFRPFLRRQCSESASFIMTCTKSYQRCCTKHWPCVRNPQFKKKSLIGWKPRGFGCICGLHVFRIPAICSRVFYWATCRSQAWLMKFM